MQKIPFDLDAMLTGGGEEMDWLTLVSRPDADHLWNEARNLRNQMDDIATAIQDRPWLAEKMLALGRVLRRPQPISFLKTALTLRQPEFAAVLRPSPAHVSISVLWGQRRVHRSRLGDVLLLNNEIGEIWYATESTEGILTGPGWKIESGDLPLLLVAIADTQAESLVATLATATKAAACLIVAEGENRLP